MFPLTRVPFGVLIFDPQPTQYTFVFQALSEIAIRQGFSQVAN